MLRCCRFRPVSLAQECCRFRPVFTPAVTPRSATSALWPSSYRSISRPSPHNHRVHFEWGISDPIGRTNLLSRIDQEIDIAIELFGHRRREPLTSFSAHGCMTPALDVTEACTARIRRLLETHSTWDPQPRSLRVRGTPGSELASPGVDLAEVFPAPAEPVHSAPGHRGSTDEDLNWQLCSQRSRGASFRMTCSGRESCSSPRGRASPTLHPDSEWSGLWTQSWPHGPQRPHRVHTACSSERGTEARSSQIPKPLPPRTARLGSPARVRERRPAGSYGAQSSHRQERPTARGVRRARISRTGLASRRSADAVRQSG